MEMWQNILKYWYTQLYSTYIFPEAVTMLSCIIGAQEITHFHNAPVCRLDTSTFSWYQNFTHTFHSTNHRWLLLLLLKQGDISSVWNHPFNDKSQAWP